MKKKLSKKHVKKYQVILHALLFISFFSLLFLPLYQMRFKTFVELPSAEQRVLAKPARLDWKTYTTFPKIFETYFNDNFPLRNNLIKMHSIVKVKYLQASPVAVDIIGRDGWLYYVEPGQNLWGGDPYTPSDRATMVEIANAQDKVLRDNNIVYLHVTVPNKQTIYAENLPFFVSPRRKTSRLEQKSKLFNAKSTVPHVDLRSSLLVGKQKYPVYYKTDTHWNKYGSFLAYQKIAAELAKRTGITPLSEEDFLVNLEDIQAKGDIAKGLYMEKDMRDTEVTFTLKIPPEENDKLRGKKLKKLIIYADSCMDPKYPWSSVQYLKNHFEEVIFIPNNFPIDLDYLVSEKPDVVIYQIVERHI